jgi:hypothetical protein
MRAAETQAAFVSLSKPEAMIRGEATEIIQRGARIEAIAARPEMDGDRYAGASIKVIQRMGAERFGVA